MLKHMIAGLIFLFVGAACGAPSEPPAQALAEPDLSDCDYQGIVLGPIFPADFSVVSSVKGIDPDSLEHTITTKMAFANGESAQIEQKYCTMYNFEVAYSLSETNKQSLESALRNIDLLVKTLVTDFKFKAPLHIVVDMNMNQRNLTLDKKFEFSIPNQVVKSSQNTEQSFKFVPEEKNVVLYIGVGGL